MAYVPTSHTHPPAADISIVADADAVPENTTTALVEPTGDDTMTQLLSPRQAADERPDGKGTFFGAGGAMYDSLSNSFSRVIMLIALVA
jgi:hypothetical protein